MPNKKSAKKYMRVTERKTIKNRIIKGVFKSAVKKTKESIAAGKSLKLKNRSRLPSRLSIRLHRRKFSKRTL
jgi:ribosomal protein S20